MTRESKTYGSRLIKNSVLTLFNTFFTAIIGWTISIWIARQLGPGNYGIFTQVLWFTGTITTLVGMGFIHAVTKYIAEYSNKNDNDTLSAIVKYICKIEFIFALVTTLTLIFFKTKISDYFFSPKQSLFFFIAFLGVIPGILTSIFSATIEGLQKFEYLTLSSIILTPLSFITKVSVLILGYGINGLLITMLIFSFINTLFYYIILHKEGICLFKFSSPINKSLKSRINNYNLNVLPIILTDNIVWNRSENFFLGRFCSDRQIGFYNLGFSICQKFTSILPATFWRVLFPAMSSYSGNGDKKKMQRLFFVSTRYLAFTAFPIGIAGAIVAYQIIHFLYGHDFIGAQRILQILFLSSIITSMGGPGAAVLYGYERQSFIYKLGFIMAIINILLNIIIIPKYGAVGAAICFATTTVIGSVIGTIYTCITMKLTYPIVSITKLFFAAVIMGVVMEIILLQNSDMPGFIIAIITGSIVYCAAALVFGSFEKEDYILLESVKQILPHKLQFLFSILINIIVQFKTNRSNLSR